MSSKVAVMKEMLAQAAEEDPEAQELLDLLEKYPEQAPVLVDKLEEQFPGLMTQMKEHGHAVYVRTDDGKYAQPEP